MRRHIWIVCIVVGLPAWLGLGIGFALAQTNVIYPVNPTSFQPIWNSPVTLSILDSSGSDITAVCDFIPGKDYTIRVNPPQNATITLIAASPTGDPIRDGMLMTSNYPGTCTNYGDPNLPPDRDFDLSGSNTLKVYDYGGMAVVKVSATGFPDYIFIIPQDSNFNGIPDWYETKFCGSANCLNRTDDIDTGPDPLSPVGDGIANIDEYRGFRVAGQYIRGDPTRKDLFVHLVDTPQCTDTAGTFTGQGSLPLPYTFVTLDTFFSDDWASLYGNVDTLAPAVLVHRINDDEWVSNFSKYDVSQKVILKESDAESVTTDRWINKNAISPLGKADSSTPPRKFVKGVRIIQCLDLSTLSPLGTSAKSPPDDILDKDNGNAVLFVHRIVKYMLNLIGAGGTLQMKYFTCAGSKWAESGTFSPASNPKDPSIAETGVKSIIKIAFGWYLAHEALEHSYDVTATATIERKASYGYHHADGSGTNVDIKITNTLTKSANNFYIPKYFAISDEREMRVLSSQQLSQ